MSEKYNTLLNNTSSYGVLSFGFLLAKEAGIFTTLLNSDKPLTSVEIAHENKLKERYTKEILGCLSAVELVRVSSDGDGVPLYDMEEAAKEALIKNEIGLAEMSFIKVFFTRYNAVRDSMDIDKPGVIRYDQNYFNAVDEYRKKLAPETIECILKNVHGLKENLEKGIDVIEFGCGHAYVLSMLAGMFPNSKFTATDVRLEFVEPLKEQYSHISNLKFDIVDLCAIPETVSKKFDWIFVNDVVHDLPHPVEALKGIKRMMKEPDGVFTFIDKAGTGSQLKDVGNMSAAMLYVFATFACIPESFQSEDSEAHGASVGKETVLGFIKGAGLAPAEVVHIDSLNALYIAKHNSSQ